MPHPPNPRGCLTFLSGIFIKHVAGQPNLFACVYKNLRHFGQMQRVKSPKMLCPANGNTTNKGEGAKGRGEHYELQQQENSLKSHLCGLLQLNSGATLFMQK